MLPPSAKLCCHPVQRNAATFGDHQRVCKISSTPKAGGGATAVRSGRGRSQALESKVRFADHSGVDHRTGKRSAVARKLVPMQVSRLESVSGKSTPGGPAILSRCSLRVNE